MHAKFHLDPSNRLATIHQRYRQTDRTGQTGQRSDSIGRIQTVAQKLKPGLVASYNLWPANGAGTTLAPGPHGAKLYQELDVNVSKFSLLPVLVRVYCRQST